MSSQQPAGGTSTSLCLFVAESLLLLLHNITTSRLIDKSHSKLLLEKRKKEIITSEKKMENPRMRRLRDEFKSTNCTFDSPGIDRRDDGGGDGSNR